MATDGVNIGIMDPAYFVGKRELLVWINDFLDLNIAKIEDTASGTVSCQIIDACYPGTIKLSKVNFGAKHEYEFIKNYKVLQDAFNKLNLPKHVPVERLVRAKYQDNLEMMQWMKAFFDNNYNDANEYNAAGRRAGSKGGKAVPTRSAAVPGASRGTVVTKEKENVKVALNRAASKKRVPISGGVSKSTTSSTRGSSGSSADVEGLKLKLSSTVAETETLKKTNGELSVIVDGLEKERDFYFGKLRDIEIFLQSLEDESSTSETPLPSCNFPEVKEKVFKILYATEEDFEADPEVEEEK